MITNRLQALRNELKLRSIDAIIITGNDPHFSEYPANRWKYRKWISGFSGTAGTLTITQTDAALWVDSRYFIQAREQLKNTGIEMRKFCSELPYIEWLKSHLDKGAKIGVDAGLVSVNIFKTLQLMLNPLLVEDIGDVFDKIYPDRPALPETPVFILPDELTGKSRAQKLSEFIAASIPNGEMYIVSVLDEIAWMLNIRASDIKCCPLAISCLIIEHGKTRFFISESRISKSDRQSLENDGITILPYCDFFTCLANIPKNKIVKLDFNKTSYLIYKSLQDRGIQIIEEKDTVQSIAMKKAVKNGVELAGFRDCMIADGVAMLRFIKWMNENAGKICITETQAAQKLEEYRSQGKNYIGLSFNTISAYGANAALPHYSPHSGADAIIKTDTFYLVDSGAQYLTGTTDITRTLHFGIPSDEEKEDYTLVLKGLIDLSMAVFPENTRGSQLDILARNALWKKGKNFLHGTGHGVGHFLNVHEGPHSIRCEENPVALTCGMITSIEPAIYIEGKYGIRTENLVACMFDKTTAFGSFNSFETLTLCPIDLRPIDVSLMNTDEINWLNNYHQRVYQSLSPYLDNEENEYLKKLTCRLS
ncbi:MAG: aminopeptidase P family protein [Prevotellaceae bacterium]|jgi:Xaa-Pro aminopeptidase|nr:aminopeptidase P family protein [Prevotellaceae bacterium]